jgi:hypothetical protein
MSILPGLLTLTPYRKTIDSWCGAVSFHVLIGGLSKKDNGWIIQHFAKTVEIRECADGGRGVGCSQVRRTNPVNPNYEGYEAWKVIKGKVYLEDGYEGGVDHPFDLFQTADEGKSCGKITINGTMKFISNYRLTKPPWGHDLKLHTGELPNMSTPPPGWSESNTIPHRLEIIFDCCCLSWIPPTVTTAPWSNPKPPSL